MQIDSTLDLKKKDSKTDQHEVKKVKIIMSTLFLFLNSCICWLPYLVPRFLAFVHIQEFSSRTFIYTVIGTTYISTLNPYIIFYTRKDLRLAKNETIVKQFHRQKTVKGSGEQTTSLEQGTINNAYVS